LTPPGSFEREGLGPVAGTAAAGDNNPFMIPSLPPLPPQRGVPRRPSLLAPVRFPYPPNTRVQGGRVRVRILLDDKGNVEEMRVMQAAPPGVFDSAALAVLRSARYAPGFVGPNALRSYLFMEVTFGPGPQGQQLWYAGDARAPAKGQQ
jgi:TonB family protein